MSSLLDRLADRAQQVIDVLRNLPGKELDLLTILELGEGALRDPEAETTSKTIASDETQISDESDDDVTVIMASSTPRISKSSPTTSQWKPATSGGPRINSTSSITPKTSKNATRIVKSSSATSQSIKAAPTSSGVPRIAVTSSKTIPIVSTNSGVPKINSTSSTTPKTSRDSTGIVKSSPTPSGEAKSTSATSGEARISSTSSTTLKTPRNSIRIVKSSPTNSQSINSTPPTSGEPRINSTPSNPIKTEPESPRNPESSRKRSEVVDAPSPAVKKRRSGPKGVRHPFLGIDNQKMWEFVIDTMNREIENDVNHSAKNLAKGIDIWDEFYDKYDDPSAEYENMHSPASLQTHFCRIFEDLPTCEYMDADTKLKFLNHSKYRISEEFRRQLEKDTKSRIICDKDGVIVKVQPNVVILVDSDESDNEEEELPETDPE
ncbi:unnamed protein product [Caenorhabditis nigoni]